MFEDRLRVVSNFGDGDLGRTKYTRAHEILRRRDAKGAPKIRALPSRRVSSIFRARVCISPAPQSPAPKLETTRSLV